MSIPKEDEGRNESLSHCGGAVKQMSVEKVTKTETQAEKQGKEGWTGKL